MNACNILEYGIVPSICEHLRFSHWHGSHTLKQLKSVKDYEQILYLDTFKDSIFPFRDNFST